MNLIFEWDRQKAASNKRKHGISFEEASTIFRDENLITFRDDAHSEYEERFLSLGISELLRVLLVVHTEIDRRPEEIVIRIISSRKATKLEIETYEKG